jgi:hypothetical protein
VTGPGTASSKSALEEVNVTSLFIQKGNQPVTLVPTWQQQDERVYLQGNRNLLEFDQRRGMLGVLELAHVPTAHTSILGQSLLAQPTIVTYVSDIMGNSGANLHNCEKAMKEQISPRDICYNRRFWEEI